MKRIILLTLIAISTFSACKKDKKQNKPLDEAIISTTWNSIAVKYDYYNEAGTSIHTETGTPGDRYVFRDSTKTVRITTTSGSAIKDYSLQTLNGKHYLTISNALGSKKYEITEYTDKTMTWIEEELNQPFGNNQVAAKKVTTINLHCPCKD